MLTPWLHDTVRAGQAILFLGAGAIHGASGPLGERPLNGSQLRDALAEKFLGGANKDKSLARVAEFAKSESSLKDVQTFIRGLYLPLQPPSYFQIIPAFRWFAIVTTNYDLTIERAYENQKSHLQLLEPILRDGDRLSSVLRNDTALPFLKLHGSICSIGDESIPLILATEEYARHRRNRNRLFSNFRDWAQERPVIFAGYDIADPNVLQILFDLGDLGLNRPAYAVVDPYLDEIAVRYWTSKRFVVVRETFETFLQELDRTIPNPVRILAAARSTNPLSFHRWVGSAVPPSERLRVYLDGELAHVHPAMPVPVVNAKQFYAGASEGWAPITAKLHARRVIADDVILSSVLDPPRNKKPRVLLLKGHAGSGISVTLRQVAWEAAHDFDALVFYLNEGAVLRPDLVLEIAALTGVHFLLVVDDAISRLDEVADLYRQATDAQISLDIVLGARTNEWNMSGGDSEYLLEDSFELRGLSDAEIHDLLGKLEFHDSLGELKRLPRAEQADRFKLFSARQLLVALHEATTGKSFEELVLDEFERISPKRAQLLYLDICTLHRLGVAVRAGLISRVAGIKFSEFESELFAPLEHVVFTFMDYMSRDHAYRTRHSVIAEFVFGQALPDAVERAAQIKRIVRHMNVDYESDSIAFGKLIKGKTLADLFADKRLVSEIFEAAAESGAPQSYIDHQRAVFELNHLGGDMRAALRALDSAEQAAGAQRASILHTKALVLRKLALQSNTQLEKDKYRSDARLILRQRLSSSRTSHDIGTLVQLNLDELTDRLRSQGESTSGVSDLEQRALAELIRATEQSIYGGLQTFPSDEYLLAHEAHLGDLLNDHPRALRSLRDAFDANPSRGFLAVRLARTLTKKGEIEDAIRILQRCIDDNPTSKEAHLEMAMTLMRYVHPLDSEAVGYHLKRSFTEGDSNYSAQFWWARNEYLFGNREVALRSFGRLKNSPISAQLKRRPLGTVVDPQGSHQRYTGTIAHLQLAFGFAQCAELNDRIFVSGRSFAEGEWQKVRIGVRVEFSLAFSMFGPIGIDAEVAS